VQELGDDGGVAEEAVVEGVVVGGGHRAWCGWVVGVGFAARVLCVRVERVLSSLWSVIVSGLSRCGRDYLVSDIVLGRRCCQRRCSLRVFAYFCHVGCSAPISGFGVVEAIRIDIGHAAFTCRPVASWVCTKFSRSTHNT
jgi:hypothetical protein